MAREAYDESKDRIVDTLGRILLGDGKAEIYVTLRSYDGGPERISILKRGADPTKRQWQTGNLGRLTEDEASDLCLVLDGNRGIGR